MGFTERHIRPGGVAAVAGWQVKQYCYLADALPESASIVSAAAARS